VLAAKPLCAYALIDTASACQPTGNSCKQHLITGM